MRTTAFTAAIALALALPLTACSESTDEQRSVSSTLPSPAYSQGYSSAPPPYSNVAGV